MRRLALTALAAAFCVSANSAFAFGAPRSGCSVNVSDSGAWLQLEIYSEESGWPEAPAERQTRQWETKIIASQFSFRNTAPIDEGAERIEGYFTVNAVTADAADFPLSPWRDGWVIGASRFALSILPAQETEVDRVQIVARLAEGEIEFPATHSLGFAPYGMSGLEVRPRSTDDGAFARAFENATAIEVRVTRVDGSLVGMAAFDLSPARALADEMFSRMPVLLESYEFGTLIDSFDCNEDVEL